MHSSSSMTEITNLGPVHPCRHQVGQRARARIAAPR
jgi:hypothetical protein